ncbi:MAG: hypothetical protein M1834_000695 [Cirrosporium novae-zelandiae]|nr:MAG: hypothetical protein M1834_000695 [Cirrosporium novae-zelandiae]
MSPRFLVIGAGSRGNAYARAVTQSTNGIIGGVAEPVKFKRDDLGRQYIWGEDGPTEGQAFNGWQEFLDWEKNRRKNATSDNSVPDGFDGIFVCTQDESHMEVILALALLNIHIMAEKPLATNLQDCLSIYKALLPTGLHSAPKIIFAIGHVLRYSPHNMLLRKLLVEDEVIGDILSIEHTEPVGWWHFSHSYVRGNWRKESHAAPSLLTKSCHDIDFLLWLLCSPPPSDPYRKPHLPIDVSSTGSLKYFRRSRKPALAGNVTNCLSCPVERDCMYSAKKIYDERHLVKGNTDWPVNIVDPEIEDIATTSGKSMAKSRLHERLAEDYDTRTPTKVVEKRPWFGRCVYECDNDVCDDQVVTISWEDDPIIRNGSEVVSQYSQLAGRSAKTAAFHMIAQTEKQCERRGRVYGTKGEIEYDSNTIRVYDFASDSARIFHPPQPGGGHGGGDDGLASQYVKAVDAVKNHNMKVQNAQIEHVRCTLEEVIRSHAMVFAAEDARRSRTIVDWPSWWKSHVEDRLASKDDGNKTVLEQSFL